MASGCPIRRGIDGLAAEVGSALGVELRRAQERGLREDYVGEVAGLSLWLRVTAPAGLGPPERIAFVGEPPGPGGPYVADLLRMRTGRSWSSGET